MIQIELGLAEWPEPDAKRHHFIPQFMLNRFGKKRVCQLEKATGKPQSILVAEAASRRHLYRFEDDDGNKSSAVEGIFAMAEEEAAPALLRLEEGGEVSDHERAAIALFLSYLWARTPAARKSAEAVGEEIRLGFAATQLSDPEDFKRRMSELKKTPKELEELRQRMLGQLREGEIRSQDPDGGPTTRLLLQSAHELAMEMFAGTEWTLLRSHTGMFVTSDRGTVSFDPSPAHPWSGAAVLSSPDAETFFPISATHCLRISPGDPELKTVEPTPSKVMEINLRIYGWADRYIYGGSQKDVCAVRGALKTSKRKYALPYTPARFATLLPRDPKDDRLAKSHLARGWPPYLTALDENGIPEQFDYMVVGENGTAVEIGISSEKLVEERARKAGGYTEGEPMPGGVNIDSVSPLSILPTRS
ncbi:MAG: hypothetical protein QOF06_561 [Solirubrobacterales bacterium]|jgi:hypothetical protein|nr:hypothetical protein [Solirubrobacterales bacterium]